MPNTEITPAAGPDNRAVELLLAYRALDQNDFAGAAARCQALLARDGDDADALCAMGLAEARSGAAEGGAKKLVRAATLQPRNGYFHYQLANVYQDQGKIDRAIASYRRAIRLNGACAEYHNDLGTAYNAKGWVDETISSYRRAIRFSPAHEIAYENIGAALRRKGELKQARAYLAAALRLRIKGRMRKWFSGGKRSAGSLSGPVLGREAVRFADLGNLSLAAALAEEASRRAPGEPRALYVMAIARRASGDVAAALELARTALEAAPGSEGRLLVGLAELLALLGHPEEALAALRRAEKAHSREPGMEIGLGRLLFAKGVSAESKRHFERALRLNPESVEARLGSIRVALKSGDAAGAEKMVNAVLAVEPEHFEALLLLAGVWRAMKRFDEAQALCRRVSRMTIDGAADWRRLGTEMRELVLYEEALACFDKAVELEPQSPLPLTHRGLLLTDIGRPQEAIRDLERALDISPGYADAVLNLGRALYFAGRYDEALERYEEAARLRPGWSYPFNLKGTWLESRGRYAEAAECYRESLRSMDDPSAAVNLAHMMLVLGDLRRGWQLYERRYELEEYRIAHARLTVPRWDGTPLTEKRIAVYGEQGIGDEICFASCMPDLLRLEPSKIFLTCDAKLGALFRRSFPGVEVFGGKPQDQTAWLRGLSPAPDVQVAAGSLHHRFRNRMEDFPRQAGYLRADESKVVRWREKLAALGPGLKIGLSWKGGIIRTGELRRTLELGQLVPILGQSGAHFVSLQYTECKQDLEDLKARHGSTVHHWQEAIDDYDETAALVAGLDLIITVCTAVVHLGGALGKPVWVMTPIGPHWRYAMQPEGMPWYPGVRLFRQKKFGEWDEVLERVLAELEKTLAAPHAAIS